MWSAVWIFPAVAVAFFLLWSMQAMIGVEGELDEPSRIWSIDFVRLQRETEVETKKREIPDKQVHEEAPIPDISMSAQRPGEDLGETMAIMDSSIVELGDASDLVVMTDADSEIAPLVRVEPLYPPRAAQAGVTGWVEVEFTITAAGTVTDARVIGFHPSTIFNRAALRAVRKWKYAPQVENGRAVPRPGVAVRLEFQLES